MILSAVKPLFLLPGGSPYTVSSFVFTEFILINITAFGIVRRINDYFADSKKLIT